MTDPHPPTVEPEASPEPAPASAPTPIEARPPEPALAPELAGDVPGRAQPNRTALPVLGAIGFLLLAAGVVVLWTQQKSLTEQIDEQARQIAGLSRTPPPAATPAAAPGASPADVAALAERLRLLEQRAAAASASSAAPARVVSNDADVSALARRVAMLEAKAPPPPPDTAGAMAPLAARLDSVASASADAQAATTTRLADLEARLKQAEQQQAAVAARAGQATRLIQAEAALAAGEPLGDLPNAPPALSKFATAKPPTEADLRLSFAAAADAAEEASRPSVTDKDLPERMWLRVLSLITVRRGDTVLVGAPAATVLGEAHARLEAGDLAGALAALDELDGKAAEAMAAWRARARALLDARAALARLARA